MEKRISSIIFIVVIALVITGTAFADIKPAGNAWENPDILVENGEGYLTGSPEGYVVVWEKPERDVDGEYMIVENDLPVIIKATLTYRNDVPWGQVQIDCGKDANGETVYYEGWVMMSDLLDSTGSPAYVAPLEAQEITPTQAPSETENANGGIVKISNSYNNAIVYTCLAIAAGALALVAYVIIKHKAFNEKGA